MADDDQDDHDGHDDDENDKDENGLADESGRNRFFRLIDRTSDRPPKGRVYAALEVPAVVEDGNRLNQAAGDDGGGDEPIYLECIDRTWLDGLQLDLHKPWSRKAWAELIQSAPISILQLTRTTRPTFPQELASGDIAWFEIDYQRSGPAESDARIYNSLFDEGLPVKIEVLKPLPAGWQRKSPVLAIEWIRTPSAVLQEFERMQVILKLMRVDSAGGVAIYDVGQGACQAALTKDRHLPSIYVDFGGGVLFNSKTFPKDFRRFCFTNRPMIILSHWDWDHWSSAYRDTDALDAIWLAPPVPLTPIQLAFAADLYVRNKLVIWDHTWPLTIRAGVVRLERCTGNVSNDSGIAVTLYAAKSSTRNCLLPGDAAYKYIPSVVLGNTFNALSMTHHGGRLHSVHYPKPKRGSASALSVGPRNTYKHPLFQTIGAHLSNGWKYPTVTALSGQRPCHVLLPWGNQPEIFRGGCFKGHCSVAIAELVPTTGVTVSLAMLTVEPKKKKAKLGVT